MFSTRECFSVRYAFKNFKQSAYVRKNRWQNFLSNSRTVSVVYVFIPLVITLLFHGSATEPNNITLTNIFYDCKLSIYSLSLFYSLIHKKNIFDSSCSSLTVNNVRVNWKFVLNSILRNLAFSFKTKINFLFVLQLQSRNIKKHVTGIQN